MTSRRAFLAASIAATASPFVAVAQQRTKTWRIGYLAPMSPSAGARLLESFRQGLRELGYVEGQNISIDYRWAEGRVDLFPALAEELVRLGLDCIVSGGADAVTALTRLTKTIPIVIANIEADPVKEGIVASFARPGGNVTGMTAIGWELAGKRLELLLEIAPRTQRIGVLFDPRSRAARPHVEGTQEAARKLGKQLQLLEARDPQGIDQAFKAAQEARTDALSVIHVGLLQSHRSRIAKLAMDARLPAIYSALEFVADGGLVAYAPDIFDQFRRAAVFVDKILKGTKPGEIPVEQPTTFELAVNMKTAKALGITLPQTVLMRVNKTIE